MGLLGGFKAKLIGKTKKTNNPVVCVKFNTFSEFETPENSLPSCSNANLGKNDVIKQRRRTTKREIKNVFEQLNGNILKPVDSEEKTEIIKPQPLQKSLENIEKIPTQVPDSQILKPPENNHFDSNEDDGNFKIHIAQNHNSLLDLSDSSSEDEVESIPTEYTSQAIKIFFDELEEPKIERSRNFQFNDDDDNLSDGSSASA